MCEIVKYLVNILMGGIKLENIREDWIDNTKGFAILLVVMGHMFRGFTSANMYNYSSLKYVDFTIYSFHMPLFLILSGYLYAKTKKVDSYEKYKKTALYKILNLGIPYIIFTLIQAFINIILGSKTNSTVNIIDLLKIPIKPLYHFWFLYALLVLFLIIPLLEMWIKNEYAILVVLCILKIASPYLVTNIYFIDSFCFYACYFYVGKIVCLKARRIINSNTNLLILSLIYVFLNLASYTFFNNNNGILEILLSLTGSALAIFITKFVCEIGDFIRRMINVMGKYSFEIYLLHIIPMSGIRIILSKILKINNFALHTVLGIIFGIGIPIVIGYIAHKIGILDFIFYPTKYIYKNKRETTKVM